MARLAVWLLILGGALCGCGQKVAPELGARRFFEQIAAGESAAAYRSAAVSFQTFYTPRFFEVAVREMGLTDGQTVQVGPGAVNGRRAEFEVEVATKTGARIPLHLTLNDESGGWRVFALRGPVNPETKLADDPFSRAQRNIQLSTGLDRELPPEAAIRRLVVDSLQQISATIQKKNYQAFYERLALWRQQQITTFRVKRDLQPWVQRGVNLANVTAQELVLEPPPRFNTEGEIVVTGSAPVPGGRATFSLIYHYETPKWWLSEMTLGVIDAG